MLDRVEKIVAVLSWVAAGLLVLMLFIGPQVIADDESKPSAAEAKGAAPYAGGDRGGGASVDGKQLFSDRCGSCHTLSAAGTTGQVGPNLDDADVDAAEVEQTVREGRGVMPSFEGELSDEEIAAIAMFVAGDR